jgi:hypothetical protein
MTCHEGTPKIRLNESNATGRRITHGALDHLHGFTLEGKIAKWMHLAWAKAAMLFG